MAKQVRVGIVGCGKIAERNHIPGFKSTPGATVAALCDVVTKRMKAVQAELAPDAELFADAEEMYKSGGLDAVSICTPNSLHYPQTMAAIKAGLHVLCDKPMAATLPEATRMIEAAKRADKVLQINQSLRYSPPYVAMADLVRKGKIGEVMHVRCLRTSGTTPDKSWSPGAKWFVSQAFQGGLILDIAIHMADLMKWLVGDVDRIAALVDTRTKGIDVPDNVRALFRFENGASGTLELSWTFPAGGGHFEVYGTKGTIRMGFTPEPIQLTRITSKGPSVTYPKPKAGLKNSQQCFVAAINGKADSPTPGELGRDALAMCDAIAKSGATGRFVKVRKFDA